MYSFFSTNVGLNEYTHTCIQYTKKFLLVFQTIGRGSALYEHGGFYLDVDVGVRHDLWMDLSYETEFVTAKVHQQSNWLHHFFQELIATFFVVFANCKN